MNSKEIKKIIFTFTILSLSLAYACYSDLSQESNISIDTIKQLVSFIVPMFIAYGWVVWFVIRKRINTLKHDVTFLKVVIIGTIIQIGLTEILSFILGVNVFGVK